MRLTELKVTAFQSIASAQVAFEPGLTVLFGPNDLGKSTLITAIRAALLLPSRSAAGSAYRSWYSEQLPQVSLSFVHDDRSSWRIVKEFGGGREAAELFEHRANGGERLVAQGRQADDRLRDLLSWGVPPLGSSVARGLPDSFLATTLLGAQNQAGDVLHRGLDDDAADSGRARLLQVLASLAEDPLQRRVRERVDAAIDLFFTPTGKRKLGSRSPFSVARSLVQDLEARLAEAKAERSRAQEVAQRAEAARHQLDQAEGAMWRVSEALAAAQFSDTREKDLAFARRERDRLEKEWRRVESAISDVDVAMQQLRRDEERWQHQLDDARETKERRDRASASLTTKLRMLEHLSTGADARESALARATIEARLAESSARVETLRARHGRAQEQLRWTTQLGEGKDQLSLITARVEALEHEMSQTRRDLERAQAVLALGRFRESVKASKRANDARLQAVELRAQAAELERQAQTLESPAEREVLELAQALPDEAVLDALLALESELQRAEAHIGGGLSLTVRPQSDTVRISVQVDDDEAHDAKVVREERYDAERKIQFGVGKLVELTVVAGTKEARQHRDALARRFRTEVLPVLQRANAASLQEVRLRLKQQVETCNALQASRERCLMLRQQARDIIERAALLEGRAPSGTFSVEASPLSPLPQEEEAVVEAALTAMGAGWEQDCENHIRSLSQRVETLVRELQPERDHLNQIRARVEHLEELVSATEFVEAGQLARELQQALVEEESLRQEQQRLDVQQGGGLAHARAEVAALRAELEREELRADEVGRLAQASSLELAERRGRLKRLEEEVQQIDRAALERKVERARRVVMQLQAQTSEDHAFLRSTQAEFEAVRTAAEQRRDAYHQAVGALMSVEPGLEDEVARLEEALEVAKSELLQLELDADGWWLLMEAIRSSEHQHIADLGRALSQTLGDALADLTQGRYQSVSLANDLRTQAVSPTGVVREPADVIDALSVGTRDQLATLIRVTVARHLRAPLVLDDQLVHADAERLRWLNALIRQAAVETQVIVVTCRPQDYAGGTPVSDAFAFSLADGTRFLNLAHCIQPWPQRTLRRAKP
jgi:uncharacterized protein YhaN